MSRIGTAIAYITASLIFVANASAAPIMVRDNPDNGGSVFATGLGRSVSIEYGGMTRNVGAGAFSLQYGSDADGWTDFLTFCLQLSEFLTLPKLHDRVADIDYIANPADRDALAGLINNFLDPATGLENSTSAAAMQVIIWEIMEDGAAAFDLENGSFQVNTNDVKTIAESFWMMIANGGPTPYGFDVFKAAGTQDLITLETPIPGALPLLLTGFAGLQIARRRKIARV